MRDPDLDDYPMPAQGERLPVKDPAFAPRLNPRPADNAVFPNGMLESLARIEVEVYRRLAELGAPPVRRVITIVSAAANPVWTTLRVRIVGIEIIAAPHTEAARGTVRLVLHGVDFRCPSMFPVSAICSAGSMHS